MEFFAGLVLGAIFGVIADRAFAYLVERRPFLKIGISMYHDFQRGASLHLHITNEGVEPLPPYTVVLFNPNRGTLRFFEHLEKTDRLPGQRDVFTVSEATLLQGRVGFLSWLTACQPTEAQSSEATVFGEMTQKQHKKWSLQLTIDGSEGRVLYQNNRIGVALVDILVCSLRKGVLDYTGEQSCRAQVTTSPWARWRDWWQMRRILRKLEGKSARRKTMLPASLSKCRIGRLFRWKGGDEKIEEDTPNGST